LAIRLRPAVLRCFLNLESNNLNYLLLIPYCLGRVSSLRTVEDFRQVLATVMTAVARGQIAPAEAARVARRVRARSRALRRCARLTRRLARTASPQPPLREDARV